MENINLKTKVFQQRIEQAIKESELPPAILFLVMQNYTMQLDQQFSMKIMEENEAIKKEQKQAKEE